MLVKSVARAAVKYAVVQAIEDGANAPTLDPGEVEGRPGRVTVVSARVWP